MFFLGWLVVLLGVLHLYMSRNYRYWKRKGVTFLEPQPFVGNLKRLLTLNESPGTFLAKMYDMKPGEPYVGFFIFDRPALLLRDPDVIQKVMATDFRHFTDRFTSADEHRDPLGARNVFVAKGQLWRRLRTRLAAAFTSGKLRLHFPAAEKIAQQLRDHLATHRGCPTDVKVATARAAADVVCCCVLGLGGASLADLRSEFREHGRKVVRFSPSRAVDVLACFFAPAIMTIRRCAFFHRTPDAFFRRVFRESIARREESGGRRHDLIDVLVRMKREASCAGKDSSEAAASSVGFADEDLAAQAAILFTAGSETTSIATGFALYELAANPAVQQRLRAEISSTLANHGGRLTYDAVRTMTYLNMVLAETLRLYPSLPYVDRKCVEDFTIPGTGVTIERGTPIYIPLLGMHRDPRLFPDPLCFKPERFEPGDHLPAHRYAYMPFGGGPRLCIGKRFGEMSAKLALIHILSSFEVHPCEETPALLTLSPYALFLRNKGKIPLVFKQTALPANDGQLTE